MIDLPQHSDEIQWLKLARVDDFKPGMVKSYKILARNLGIVCEAKGKFFAIEVSCKHQLADLTTGRIQGLIVTCPRHGWRYDLRTGKCLNQSSAPLRRHALEIRGDDIYVSMHPLRDDDE